MSNYYNQDLIIEQQNKIEQLERENQRIKECCDWLRKVASEKSPQTSLAERDAQVIENALEQFWPDDMKGTELWNVLKQHAQQIRNEGIDQND